MSKVEPFEWNFCPICGDELEPHHDGESHRPHCLKCNRFYYKNPVPAACCVVRKGEQLLLVKRGVEPCIGQWCLPGGFVELGESTQEAAIRELSEETGLIGAQPELIHVSTQPSLLPGAVIIVGYEIREFEGELKSGSDVLDLKFYDIDDMPEIPFTAHREILSVFYEN